MQPVPTDADGQVNMGDLLLADIELAGMYRECAEGKAGLIRAVESMTHE